VVLETSGVIDLAKVEVLKVWYSLFCVLVDSHAEGESSDTADAIFIQKMYELRRQLAEKVPEVEKEFARQRQ
jgi:hypothetical protein